MSLPNREEAFKLFSEYNKTQSLIKHGLTVEGIMIHFSELYEDQNSEEWGTVGLIHDIDYEMFPEEHCTKAGEILTEAGWPEWSIRAMKSHGYEICTDVKPETDLEKVLYTIDELSGLITATALMRPSKSVSDLKVKSVMKKWKTKSFAAGVDRELITKGCEGLGMTIQEVIEQCILGMRKISDSIGL